MAAAVAWQKKANQALSFIDFLGDVAIQRAVFGDKLEVLRDTLHESSAGE